MTKINQLSPQGHNFTSRLTDIARKPQTLYYMGTLPDGDRKRVAIVGSRKPTSYGKEVTMRLASALAQRGVVIVSGLALGVDGIAHRAALEVGGTTVAVLGNGLPTIYPASHTALAHELIENGGAILSEYPEREKARPYYFLQRNRLVSGLADAVIITEAAHRSGTLNTAQHALEQGRDVFVVPGNITSPLSEGCNNLLLQGANPITSVEDFCNYFAPIPKQPTIAQAATLGPEEQTILDLITSGVRDNDQLQAQSNIPSAQFSIALTMLELHGLISRSGNDWILR